MRPRARRSARRPGGPPEASTERHSLAGTDLSRTTLPGGRRPPPRPWPPRGRIEGLGWRALALVLALLQIGLLAWLLNGSVLAVRHVDVTGAAHLSRREVLAVAGLDRPVSVARVDGATIRRNLERLPWVRTASAEPLLPDRVSVRIEEWKPVAVYRGGAAGHLYYLNDQGGALGPAEAAGALVVIQGAGGDPRVGSHPIDAQLLAALVRIEAAFPGIYGAPIVQFDLDCMGALTATTPKGVRIVFGRVLTPEEFASLPAKLSALKSIAAADAEVKNQDRVEYINLEDVQQPAVKFKGDKPPPSPLPAPGSRPSPAPSPTGQAPIVVGPLCR